MSKERPIDKSKETDAEAARSTSQTAEAFSETLNTKALRRAVTGGSLQPGDKLGKYEIRKELGAGGMGAVYLAFDPMIEREVAIKVLPPHVASQPKALDRFLSEARATGKLNHPNVVAIYDIGQEGDVYYIVMELVRGGSGAEFIANRSVLDWKRACAIAMDATEGLAAAHAVGLIHRDIKPENLMLTDQGIVKVVDFGLAKLVDAANQTQLGLTNAGQMLGTPHYMSPEQFQGQRVDARSDVYNMGATLYCLLTGQPPFADATNMVALMRSHLAKTPPDPTERNREMPSRCRDIVSKAMAKEPDQRYADAGELATALREVLSAAKGGDQVGTPQTYRALRSAVVVEPSKMQAMMFEKALQNAGASAVTSCGSAADAQSRCESEAPDLLITAMQLPDSKGGELIRQLREVPTLCDTVLVLNSSDPDVRQLAEVTGAGPAAVVSKATKPKELLRALHSCTFLDMRDPMAPPEFDATVLRLVFVCDGSRIPDPIASLVRDANFLDVQVTTFDELAVGKELSGAVDLVIALRTAGDAAQDAGLFVDLLARVKLGAKSLAAVQVDGQRITLRAIQWGDFTAICRCPLDNQRMMRVAQLCQ